MNKLTLIFVLCVAFASVSLQRAAAQEQIRVGQANAAPQHQTKVLRIYGGAGSFDIALAEKLRPMLDKAFPVSRTDAPKAVPGVAVAAPAKPESQMKVAEAAYR